ncbi:MAG: SDR family NAD(P)-dependent oxidoreductase [Cocleimonas sp.]
MLFLNAGVLLNEKIFNKDQIEQHFATNSLAPYFLTLGLMPLLQQSKKAKVVVSGSGASRMVKNIDVSQLINPTNFKPMSGAYAQSKATVKVLFSYLQKQYKNIDFSVVELPPTKTKMAKSEAMPVLLKWFSFVFSSAEKSANKLYQATVVYKGINLEKKHNKITEKLITLAGQYSHGN